MERQSGVQRTQSGIIAHVLVFRVALLHDFLHLYDQLRIGFQPLLYLSAIEVFRTQIRVFLHTGSQLFGSVGYLVLGSIKGNVQVFHDDSLIDGHILSLQRTLYFVEVPALVGILDEQTATDFV